MKKRILLCFLTINLVVITGVFAQTPFYPSNAQVKTFATDLASSYSSIVQYNELGTAKNISEPIFALKISDNVSSTEDEPVWIFTGVIHGREQIAIRTLIDLADELASGYSSDPDIQNWVNAYEIWIILDMNPYGYENYLRKNGPNYGGVDLNRNWDFRWSSGGSTNLSASDYRGPSPESEPETQAVANFYRNRRPVFGLTFHQGNDPDGGQIMRPWGSSTIPAPPDADKLREYSNKYADYVYDSRLTGGFCQSTGGGNYEIMDPDGSTCGSNEGSATYCKELCWRPATSTMGAYGQSSNWCYSAVGTIDLTVEVSDRLFNESFLHSSSGPSNSREEMILSVVTEFARNHREAIKMYFQDFYNPSDPGQFGGTGITGNITNSSTGAPVEAVIEVSGYTSTYITDRTSEPDFGRYWRFLPSGTHNIEVRANGYETWNGSVNVSSGGSLTQLDVQLVPEVVTPKVGISDVLPQSTTSANRRAMPFVMPENGIIESITMYHQGGSGNMILGVYEGTASTPTNRIGVTASTAVSSSTGWQKIDLITPVQVNSNENIWLAWVYETNPGIAYDNGTPGRVDAGVAWSGGMPSAWGSTATSGDYIYSVYADYTPGSGGNVAPVAEANGPYNGEVNASVVFSSAGSNDSDGSIASYAWNFGDGGTSTQANPSHTYTSAGTYTAALTVTDNEGATGTDQANVTITDGTVASEEFGILDLKTRTTTTANRRAMPLVVPQSGTITSLSMRHVGGSGSMILGVYEGTTTAPGNRIGVTATTAVSGTDGWQEIVLQTPVHVNAGQNIFLAWVYETNPGIYYDTGDPGRVDAGTAWSGGMPSTWGSTATQSSYLYNIKAIYTPDAAAAPAATVAQSAEPVKEVVNEDVTVYPNPSGAGIVSVNIQGKVGLGEKIQLFNIAGMLIKSVKAEQGTQEIDLGDFSSGIYIISIPTNGSRVNKRLIIQ